MSPTLLALSLGLSPAVADEGMWLPEQLPAKAEELRAMGLELDPAELADPMGRPLGSIVTMGFCSASFISPDGLVATNHHCVTGYLGYLSDEARDLNDTGHLAGSRAEELWVGPGSEVQVVEKITDVTAEVLAGLRKRTEDFDRERIIARNQAGLVAACEEGRPSVRCQVVDYFGGQQYRLIEKRRLRDVRLVYAPPDSVGNYGDEIDNWMWPRHTGDFSLLRVYVAPDGSAAEHAEENVPYQPPQHLEINPEGASPGDFVMVAGYPGRTYRFRSARQMRFARDVSYPLRIALSEAILEVLRRHSAESDEAAAKLAPSIGYVSNGLKYSQGMLDGFRGGVSGGTDVVTRKAAAEARVQAWIAADKKRAKRYGPVFTELDALQEVYEARYEAESAIGWMMYSADLLGAAHGAVRWATEQEKPDLDRDAGFQERDREQRLRRLERMQKSLHLPSDREIFTLMLDRVLAQPEGERVKPLDEWVAAMGGRDAALDALYAEPSLATAEARLALMDATIAELRASTDPWVSLAVALEAHLAPQRRRDKAEAGAMSRLEPLAIEALQGTTEGVLYPDANSSLRITVGHVRGYEPEDGLVALPQTTLSGVVAKAGEWPFDAPAPLLEAATRASESRWFDAELGDVPANFLTTLDTTGGNSGSATLDGRGRLVGLIFDGNYEAMSADWLFDPEMTRSIHVDVRYMLWLLEEVEEAGWILEELGFGPG